MNKKYLLIILSLTISLIIYLFFRTEKTVINQLFIFLFSYDTFATLREKISNILPLNEHIIYSLPEGLWVFCISITSRQFFIKIRIQEFNLLYLPLIFTIGLEVFQLFQFTHGRFDYWDIGFSLFFWILANYGLKYNIGRYNITSPITQRSMICFFSYSIVFFAHVWKP